MPGVLVLHVIRFNMNGEKLNFKFNFNENLSFGGQDYQLYGVIQHEGNSIKSGHYFAYIKNTHGIWFEVK